ncbi:MAG: SulP family inorganic anion transporter [Allosphingosinicella sp.]
MRPIPRGSYPGDEAGAPAGLAGAGGTATGGALARLPGWRTLRAYRAAWLRDDAVAGIVLSAMLVPVGVAYAVASGVPAINGLYATAIPLLVYALFGPSRILVLGPDSSLAPVILGVVVPLAAGVPERAVAVAAAMAVVSGAVCMLAGILRLGFVTELLSKPIRYGYMNGMAVVVLISQLPKLLGFSIESEGPLRDLWAIGEGIAGGRANWAAAALGIGTFAIIRLSKRFARFPGILAAVVGATAITAWLGLAETAGVKVLGPVPQGLPDFAIPWLRAGDIVPILAGGIAVAIVAFADTSILSRTFAVRTGTRVDPSQEMVALGAANLAAGFFQGFPVSSSSSRTPVAEAAGARTQLTGVVGALIVGLVIVAAPMLFRDLPYAALAGVVISAALGLFELTDLRRIYRIQRWEFWLCILCTLGVAVFGAIAGIGVAIAFAVLEFLWDAWRPHFAILGEPDGVEGYHDVTRYPDARRIAGVVLFRWDAPLFFANAEFFNQCVHAAIAASPTPVRRVIVSGAPITGIDVTSADSLADLAAGLERDGIELCFAELKDPVKDELKRFGLFALWGETRFFPTVQSAVRAWRERPGA